MFSDGDYKFDCPRQIIYRGDINLIGSDPSRVRITVSNFLCLSGKFRLNCWSDSYFLSFYFHLVSFDVEDGALDPE